MAESIAIPSDVHGSNLTTTDLDKYKGLSVLDFCGKYGKIDDSKVGISHCAHFVCHVLKLKFPHAALCSNVGLGTDESKWTYAERNKGYCVRVDQVFNSCQNRQKVDIKSPPSGNCFIVATLPSNVIDSSNCIIGSQNKKHIGIMVNGTIYHYSNSKSKVETASLSKFALHYGAHTILFKADLP